MLFIDFIKFVAAERGTDGVRDWSSILVLLLVTNATPPPLPTRGCDTMLKPASLKRAQRAPSSFFIHVSVSAKISKASSTASSRMSIALFLSEKQFRRPNLSLLDTVSFLTGTGDGWGIVDQLRCETSNSLQLNKFSAKFIFFPNIASLPTVYQSKSRSLPLNDGRMMASLKSFGKTPFVRLSLTIRDNTGISSGSASFTMLEGIGSREQCFLFISRIVLASSSSVTGLNLVNDDLQGSSVLLEILSERFCRTFWNSLAIPPAVFITNGEKTPPGAIIIWVPRSDFTGARYQKSLLRPTFFKRL
eukprot:sb/3467256/